ncbi:hypothetical protein [Ornithinibacillus halotolerans]|uniref:Uncharacterized protein n=1 Tax=Ornithinibacillus halotolerans TaxID=1274357 RepID=A0A916S632_9BACI|nr:hypothetical protein [Ornithinibacillus halotolerans]GGA86300.1 hypothetical protein GCM10008025_31570 [Ornithinibacillus halotolerans]
MRKKRKWIIVAVILLIIVISQIFVNVKYLYNPVTFPKGNVSDITRLSYTDFIRPLVFEAVTWDNDGNQYFYQYISDEKEIKNMIKLFDKSTKLVDYSMDDFLEDMNEAETIGKYTFHLKQLVIVNGQEIAGKTLFSFDFYEGKEVFKVSNAHFYELTNEFRDALFSALSDESKWVAY